MAAAAGAGTTAGGGGASAAATPAPPPQPADGGAAKRQQWDLDDEEDYEMGEGMTASEARKASLLLLLQLVAELSANENTHDALVEAKMVPRSGPRP